MKKERKKRIALMEIDNEYEENAQNTKVFTRKSSLLDNWRPKKMIIKRKLWKEDDEEDEEIKSRWKCVNYIDACLECLKWEKEKARYRSMEIDKKVKCYTVKMKGYIHGVQSYEKL